MGRTGRRRRRRAPPFLPQPQPQRHQQRHDHEADEHPQQHVLEGRVLLIQAVGLPERSAGLDVLLAGRLLELGIGLVGQAGGDQDPGPLPGLVTGYDTHGAVRPTVRDRHGPHLVLVFDGVQLLQIGIDPDLILRDQLIDGPGVLVGQARLGLPGLLLVEILLVTLQPRPHALHAPVEQTIGGPRDQPEPVFAHQVARVEGDRRHFRGLPFQGEARPRIDLGRQVDLHAGPGGDRDLDVERLADVDLPGTVGQIDEHDRLVAGAGGRGRRRLRGPHLGRVDGRQRGRRGRRGRRRRRELDRGRNRGRAGRIRKQRVLAADRPRHEKDDKEGGATHPRSLLSRRRKNCIRPGM